MSRETRVSMKHSLLWFEFKLEESDHFEIVQIIRFFVFGLSLKEKDEEGGKEKKNENEIDDADSRVHKWSRLVIRADAKARWIVQRKKYLKEEIHALRNSLPLLADEEDNPGKGCKSRLNHYEQELARSSFSYALSRDSSPTFSSPVRCCSDLYSAWTSFT